LEQIAIWRVNIQLNQNSTQDDRELLMTLSPAYLEWREATFQEGKLTGKQEGRQEGRQEGIQQGTLEERASFIRDLLNVRFAVLDDALSGIIPRLLELPREDVVRMILQLSREDLLARFSQ
jgi:flagellar biosynthesis/type III secretory pathway protein FliH